MHTKKIYGERDIYRNKEGKRKNIGKNESEKQREICIERGRVTQTHAHGREYKREGDAAVVRRLHGRGGLGTQWR